MELFGRNKVWVIEDDGQHHYQQVKQQLRPFVIIFLKFSKRFERSLFEISYEYRR
jgi:hypothetical protein